MERKSSLSSSLLRALFNSFSGIARSIGVSESNPVLNESKVKQKKAKLRVTNHKRSDRIDFNSSCLPEIQNIVSSTMRFCSTNHKHGDIFKSQDRAVTVTVYASTSTMHIQGTNYPQWTAAFVKQFEKRENSDATQNEENHVDESETSLKIALPSNRLMTSETSDNSQNEENHNGDSETSLKLVFKPNRLLTSTPQSKVATEEECDDLELHDNVAALYDELELLRERIANLETSTKKVSDASTQTGKIGKKDMQTNTEICERVSRHVQHTEAIHTQESVTENDPQIQGNGHSIESQTSSSVRHATTNGATYAEICATPATKHQTTTKQVKKDEKSVKSLTNGKKEENDGKNEKYRANQSSKENHECDRNPSTLIIGSSILQKIDKRSLRRDVEVVMMKGAETSDVREKISRMDLSGFKNVILQVGGNDASNKRDPEAVEHYFAETVKNIKEKSPSANVFISDVTPRVGGDVKYVNDIIRHVCFTYGAMRIPTTENIRFVNFHQYYRDNIHLSEAGTTTLLKGYNEFVPILNHRAQKESCFYCGENGHNTKKCRHGEKIKCFHCGLRGHKAKHCRRR